MSINVCNDRSMASITSLPSGVSGSSLVLISTVTASNDATIDFTSGIDSTYSEYIFKIINCHPATDTQKFQVNFRDGGSNFDATKTTTTFYAVHDENATGASLAYDTGSDVAQGTGDAVIAAVTGNANDECCSGYLHLFNPSSTTFVKHFIATTMNNRGDSDGTTYNWYGAGYANVTAAIDGVRFNFASGNIDSGTIKMYGVV